MSFTNRKTRIHVIKNLCKKVTGKKVYGKKTLIKKFQFSKVRGQNVNGNTVLSFRFLGLFFVKMIRGLLSPEEKSPMSWENEVKS